MLLEVRGLAIAYGDAPAVWDATLEVAAGEVVAVIGPNGAGKTSIFNVLSGVYRPQGGRVVFDGVDLVGKRPHAIAALGMARTFQNVELFANLTVLDNLTLGRHNHSGYGPLAKRRTPALSPSASRNTSPSTMAVSSTVWWLSTWRSPVAFTVRSKPPWRPSWSSMWS